MTNLEMLRTATPEQIRDMFCENCNKCPSFIFERCDAEKNGFTEWLSEEAKTPKNALNDAPKDALQGWVKLKTLKCNIYINASTIVGLCEPNAGTVPDGVLTTIFTIGAEDNPWLICESLDEVMEKIEKAK